MRKSKASCPKCKKGVLKRVGKTGSGNLIRCNTCEYTAKEGLLDC